jgi:ketosteroid isomerase-like protein
MPAIVLAALAMLVANASIAADSAMRLGDASAVFNQWIAAYQARDAEKLMAVFDKSLVYSAQAEEDQSYAELKASYVNFFSTKPPPVRWKAIAKEIHAQAGLAVVVSIWEQRSKDSKPADEPTSRLRSIDVFKKTPAGWKIVRTINYPEAN